MIRQETETATGGRERLGPFISLISRTSPAWLSRILKPLDVSAGTYPLLLCLCQGDKRTQEGIASFLGVDKAVVKRAVDELEGKGLVHRQDHETDGRSYRIELTAKARRLEPAIQGALDDWEDRVSQGLSATERAKARSLLAHMAANAMAATTKAETGEECNVTSF